MHISNRMKFLLISLLMLLNIIIRIPSVPHEIGFDSFFIHKLANTISIFGEARWWIHPLSVFGLYPYSDVSAVPFLLSGISQCTGTDMEWTIWLFSVITGLLSAFTAYLLAGAIKDDDIFKFLVAFGYSLSPGILAFTWNVSSRGLFIVLLPLFIYLLLKARTFRMKCSLLAVILFMTLIITHHLIYFVGPVVLCFIILVLLEKFVKTKGTHSNLINIGYLGTFLVAFSYPFITRAFMTDPRYQWLHWMLSINIRYSGFLLIFAIGGFIYLSLKNSKNYGEKFILLTVLFLAPFTYIKTYSHFFNLIFMLILGGIGLANVTRAFEQKKKSVCAVIIVALLLSVSFSGFYQHWRTGMGEGHSMWYMREPTYAGALWIKENVDADKNLVGNGGTDSFRVHRMSASCGGTPLIFGTGIDALSYGYINKSYIKMKENSPLTTEYYLDAPYVEVRGTGVDIELNSFIGQSDIDKWYVKEFVDRFNFSYLIEDTIFRDSITLSVKEKKNNIYDSGEFHIWDLKGGKY